MGMEYSRQCTVLPMQQGAQWSIEMHKDSSIARVAHDEETVQKVMRTIANLDNPFIYHKVVTQVASGKHATPEIKRHLPSVADVGLQEVHIFATERLSIDGNTGFHDPLPNLGLKTFASFTLHICIIEDRNVMWTQISPSQTQRSGIHGTASTVSQ